MGFPAHIQILVEMEGKEQQRVRFPLARKDCESWESQAYLYSYSDPKAKLPDTSAPISISMAPYIHHQVRKKIPAAKYPSGFQEYLSAILMIPEQSSRDGSSSQSRLLAC